MVDRDGHFESDAGVYDSNSPFGPFTCQRCGLEYGELEDLEKLPAIRQLKESKAAKNVEE